jgi:hypothetical protein
MRQIGHLETTPFVYLAVTITTKTHIRTPRKQHTSIQRLGNHMHPLICSASPAMDVHSRRRNRQVFDKRQTIHLHSVNHGTRNTIEHETVASTAISSYRYLSYVHDCHFTAETTSETEKHGRANRT